MKEISAEEKQKFNLFWLGQRRAIEGRVSQETMRWFNTYTDKDNVGYEFGQLRPGKLGQFDLYFNMAGQQSLGCDRNETLIASGLTAADITNEERREKYRQEGVDIDNAMEVLTFERINRMDLSELEAAIAELEAELVKGKGDLAPA